jgi:hypothetical protein
VNPHKRPAAGGQNQATPARTPPGVPASPAPPPGFTPPQAAWLRRAVFGRQDHLCQCGHPRLVHVQLRWAECLRCGCGGFVRRRP